MAYDPAWDMPQVNWQQQGSFESGQIPPAVAPDAGTQVCIGPIAREWLYVVLGALDQLRNPSSWIVADDDAMNTVLRQVDKLREIVAVSEGCVPPVEMRLTSLCVLQYSNDGGVNWIDTTDWVTNFGNCIRSNFPPVIPINPPGGPPNTEACNIATYLAGRVLGAALVQRATDRTANNSVSASVANIIAAVFGNNPFIDFLTQAANYLVQTTDPQTAADVAAASTDSGFQADVVCAIFNAIRNTGYVSAANFSTVASNIAAISYPAHSWVPAMMGTFWTNLGLAVIQQMQAEGTVSDGDCSACGHYCQEFNFATNDQGWDAYTGTTHYVAGIGWEAGIDPGNGAMSLNVHVHFSAPISMTGFSVECITPTVPIAGDFLIEAFVGGSLTYTFGFTNIISSGYQVYDTGDTAPFSVQDLYFAFESFDTSAVSVVRRIQYHGLGPNPNGVDNCT